MHRLKASSALAALILWTGPAFADCGIGAGSVRILSNDFPALHAVLEAAATCASPAVEVTRNATAEHATIQVAALTPNPATYTVAVVSNDSLVPLLNEGLVRPLDDLVERFGQGLQPSQLVRIDGQIMAIAFMVNAQHLYVRQDLLARAGLDTPTSYEEVLAAAEALRAQGIIETPLAANFMPGWDLAAEFVNMYAGLGGELFAAGGAEPAIENETAVAALEMMKALSAYMSPDFVTYNTNATQALWETGQAAIMNAWGSRAASVIDAGGPLPEIAEHTLFASAPTVGGGDVPAATLWWDGFVIARNISDADAEASFQAMMRGVAPETAQASPDAAAWLIEGYTPTRAATGVIDTQQAGARPYPMQPYMGLMHTALGDNLAEFMQGQESAEQGLADAARAYVTAAREAGFLN